MTRDQSAPLARDQHSTDARTSSAAPLVVERQPDRARPRDGAVPSDPHRSRSRSLGPSAIRPRHGRRGPHRPSPTSIRIVTAGQPWINHEWLAEAIMAIAWNAAGASAVAGTGTPPARRCGARRRQSRARSRHRARRLPSPDAARRAAARRAVDDRVRHGGHPAGPAIAAAAGVHVSRVRAAARVDPSRVARPCRVAGAGAAADGGVGQPARRIRRGARRARRVDDVGCAPPPRTSERRAGDLCRKRGGHGDHTIRLDALAVPRAHARPAAGDRASGRACHSSPSRGSRISPSPAPA